MEPGGCRVVPGTEVATLAWTILAPRQDEARMLGDPDTSVQSKGEEGLTEVAAQAELSKVGPNAMPSSAIRPWRRALAKFWAPVPWMLELAIVLQLALGEYLESTVIAALLIFNAVLQFVQESRAEGTLKALRSRLALEATVRRDGAWKRLPAAGLVPGDVVKLTLGEIVPADLELLSGSVLLDDSMITGESVPVEGEAGHKTHSGALVRRGEAIGRITHTGSRTELGHTVELVQTAHVESTQQKTVMRVVRNLAMVNGGIILLLVGYALARGMGVQEVLPLFLTALLASIPVALPATFTLAAAVGAKALARVGVLPTRLSAVDEAASLDVLCSDKTGTLTQNELAVASVHAAPGYEPAQVLALASLASSEGSQDPVDSGIRSEAQKRAAPLAGKLIKLVPFDPGTRMSEASATAASGEVFQTFKGAVSAVTAIVGASPLFEATAHTLEGQGFRVLAVATGVGKAIHIAGLIALSDPPRPDAADLIKELEELGVRTVMVTGDSAATARIVAKGVGLRGAVSPPGKIPDGSSQRTTRSLPGSSPRASTSWSRPSRRAGTPWGCAVTA